MRSTVVLVIIEGWGLGKEGQENPIYAANPITMNELTTQHPSVALHASGVPVGLDWEEAGNGGFGNVELGSGRIVSPASVTRKEQIEGTLGEALSDAGKRQLRIAETATYEWATLNFNGFREDAFPGEFRIHVPSERFAVPKDHPELMAQAVTDRLIMAIRESAFDFIVASYANLDAMANTGSYEATVKAVKVIDAEMERIVNAVREGGQTLLVTSSHGNAESVMGSKSGQPETGNNTSPVPLIAFGPAFKKNGTSHRLRGNPAGILADIAPTVLDLLGVPIPKLMSGESLLGPLTGR